MLTRGIVESSLNIIGGVAEAAAGITGEGLSGGTASPLVIPLTVDGIARITLNIERLIAYSTGHRTWADAMPSNIGASIGKVGDMTIGGNSFYHYGIGQAVGSTTNDLGSFIIGGGTGDALSRAMRTQSLQSYANYGFTGFSYIYGQYGNWSTFKK